MNISTPSPHPEKTGSRKRQPAPGRPIAWRDVLAALQNDRARSEALTRYRAAEFTPDEFEHLRAAREAMTDALVRAEDSLELRSNGRMTRERLAMQAARRRLESEVQL